MEKRLRERDERDVNKFKQAQELLLGNSKSAERDFDDPRIALLESNEGKLEKNKSPKEGKEIKQGSKLGLKGVLL